MASPVLDVPDSANAASSTRAALPGRWLHRIAGRPSQSLECGPGTVPGRGPSTLPVVDAVEERRAFDGKTRAGESALPAGRNSWRLLSFADFFDEMPRQGLLGLLYFTSFRQAESNSGENRHAKQCDANQITRYSTVGFGHAGTPVIARLTFRLNRGDFGDRYQKQFALGKRVWH